MARAETDVLLLQPYVARKLRPSDSSDAEVVEACLAGSTSVAELFSAADLRSRVVGRMSDEDMASFMLDYLLEKYEQKLANKTSCRDRLQKVLGR